MGDGVKEDIDTDLQRNDGVRTEVIKKKITYWVDERVEVESR